MRQHAGGEEAVAERVALNIVQAHRLRLQLHHRRVPRRVGLHHLRVVPALRVEEEAEAGAATAAVTAVVVAAVAAAGAVEAEEEVVTPPGGGEVSLPTARTPAVPGTTMYRFPSRRRTGSKGRGNSRSRRSVMRGWILIVHASTKMTSRIVLKRSIGILTNLN